MQLKETTPLESDSHPLTFLVAPGDPVGASELMSAHVAYRCDVRGLGTGYARYQKEGVVKDLGTGRTWRLCADEGPAMRGPDCAPSPLMYWIVGLHGDVVGEIANAARVRGVDPSQIAVTVSQGFSSSGSFARGEAVAVVRDQRWNIAFTDDGDGALLDIIVAEAFSKSPLLHATRASTHGTFALYANDRFVSVQGLPTSTKTEVDPFIRHPTAPVPFEDQPRVGLLHRQERPPQPALVLSDDQQGAVAWRIQAEGSFDARSNTVTSTASFPGAVNTEWVLISDPTNEVAPHPRAYYALGTAFCFHTQMCRYADVRRARMMSPRLTQLTENGGAAYGNGLRILDTQIYLRGSIPDEEARSLVEAAAKTCFAHAALASPVAPEVLV